MFYFFYGNGVAYVCLRHDFEGGHIMDKGPADPKINEEVLAYLATIEKAKSKEIAKAIGRPKKDVDLAVKELAAEDKVEYLYITTTFVALKGKVAEPE